MLFPHNNTMIIELCKYPQYFMGKNPSQLAPYIAPKWSVLTFFTSPSVRVVPLGTSFEITQACFQLVHDSISPGCLNSLSSHKTNNPSQNYKQVITSLRTSHFNTQDARDWSSDSCFDAPLSKLRCSLESRVTFLGFNCNRKGTKSQLKETLIRARHPPSFLKSFVGLQASPFERQTSSGQHYLL